MPKRIALTTIAAIVLIVSPAAPAKRYVLKHPHHQHCKSHYVRKVKRLRRHRHHRLVFVRKTMCVPRKHARRTAQSAPSTSLPMTTAAPAAKTVALHARLDPSFVQSAADPLAVTYSYSASATTAATTNTTAATEPAPLPEGILDLYSDGALECSSTVGGEKTGSECPVTYKTTGAHQVIVTYVAGSTLATETYTETVEPYSTHTTESVSEPAPNTFGGYGTVRYIGGKVEDQHGYSLGGEVTYTIRDETTDTTQLQFTQPVDTECYINEHYSSNEPGVGEYWFYGAGTCAEKGFDALRTDKIVVIAEYAGIPGYLPSASEQATLQ